ncbi:MAG: LamG domain-containing protein [Sedimentisphaerales bacterium]
MYRRLVYLVICFFLVLGFSESAESATKVAHWRLDNDATDSAGGIDGTLMNGPEFTTDAIVGSHALALDGSASQYVDFGNPQELPSGRAARSMCGWAMTDTIAGGWKWIAAYGSEGTSLAMFIGMNGTSLYGGGYGDDIFVSGFWEIGVWHHICLTYDGSIARLYADGDEVISATKNWDLVLNRAHIGRQVNDVAEFWDGLIDDVRIYDFALSPAEVKKLAALPKATKPSPADGAIHPDTWASLSWSAGGYAVLHDVYFGESFIDVNDGTGGTFQGNRGTTYFVVGFPGYPYPDGLIPGTTYYWRIDEVNDLDPNSPWKGDVWSFTVPSKTAYNPNPPDDAKFINPDTILSWTAGFGAKLHTVFFGDNFDDVSNATEGMPAGTFTYDPGQLEYDKSYYWRIDEFDGSTTYKGNIWNFKTLPDIPISDPNLVCWWKLDEGQGTTAIDWSGHKNDGTLINGPKWVTGYDEGALEFDGSDDYINFGNTSNLPAGSSARSMCGWGKTDTVAGGWRWIAAYGSPGTSQAMFIGMNGDALYGGGYGDDVFISGLWEVDVWRHICLTYDGTTARLYADGIEVATEAKSWDLVLSRAHIGRQVNDVAEFWDGLIDDVRIYDRVLTSEEIKQAMRGDTSLAWDPSPADGSIPDIHVATSLSWSPGDKAAQHDLYFGTDKDAVENADTSDTSGIYRDRQSSMSYTPPEGIEWGGGPYYWRIDEYNTDATISKGKVWSFTVADYLSIDDFEDYDAGDNQIWYAWHDGLGYGTPGTELYYAGNGTGAVVGDETTASYTEETIVNSGTQAMPFSFDSNKQGYAKYSEVEMALTTQRDWMEQGVVELSLWFRGYAASVGSFVEGPVGTYTITASGADIWNVNGVEADEFHFAYKMLTGPGSIVAKVESVDNTNVWAKAGVMIRESLDPDSEHAFACITPSSGVASQGRYDTGGASFNTTQVGIAAPHWVKLERDISGNFTVSHSANGSVWQQVQGTTPQNIPMSANIYVGLALTAHDAALTCQAVFSNVTITGTVGPQWAHQDVGIASNDAELMYVGVSNAVGTPAVVYHDDPGAATIDMWTEWVIPLNTFADQGINLTNVDRIAIGLGTKGNMMMAGGSGKMFVDDIRLYRSRNAAEE